MLFVFREFLRLCNGIIYSYSFSVPSPSPPFLLELLLFLGCLLLIFKLFSFLWLCLLRFVGYEYARARICVAKALNHPKKQKLLLCIEIYDCIYYPFCTFFGLVCFGPSLATPACSFFAHGQKVTIKHTMRWKAYNKYRSRVRLTDENDESERTRKKQWIYNTVSMWVRNHFPYSRFQSSLKTTQHRAHIYERKLNSSQSFFWRLKLYYCFAVSKIVSGVDEYYYGRKRFTGKAKSNANTEHETSEMCVIKINQKRNCNS